MPHATTSATFVWSLITSVAGHPLSHYAITSVLSLALGMLLRRHAQTRAAAQAFADYLEAVERQAVLAAELAGAVKGLKGYDKLMFAIDYVEARLAEQGIVGDPNRVNRDRLLADLTKIKEALFPGKGTVIGHLVKPAAS